MAFSTAEKGLAFLLRTGRKDYRSRLKAILAETYIQNKSYLEAISEYDSVLRLEDEPREAARLLSRAGDIYFALNNYELAEFVYAMADRLGQNQSEILPERLARRGESLFWMGQFSESQKKLSAALKLSASSKALAPLSAANSALVALRLADGYLAQKKFDLARLEYFRVSQTFTRSESGKLAKVRSACLELPFYDGKNVAHARESLASLKAGLTPTFASELAWSCEVGSYTERERTEEMVGRVKAFYETFPQSRFLQDMIPAVKDVKISQLMIYLKEGKQKSAISYFEQTRSLLFDKVPKEVSLPIFRAYLDNFENEKAREFWPAFNDESKNHSQLDKLRAAVFLVEMNSSGKPFDKNSENALAKELSVFEWSLPESTLAETYLNRILGYDSNAKHLVWIYNLAGSWAQKEPQKICSYLYPTLARIWDHQKEIGLSETQVQEQISGAVAQNIVRLLNSDETCAVSFLDLEVDSYASNPGALAALYIGRQDWPFNQSLLELFWEVAEKKSCGWFRRLRKGSLENHHGKRRAR